MPLGLTYSESKHQNLLVSSEGYNCCATTKVVLSCSRALKFFMFLLVMMHIYEGPCLGDKPNSGLAGDPLMKRHDMVNLGRPQLRTTLLR